MEVAADAVEHLPFEPLGFDSFSFGVGFELFEDGLVLAGDGGVVGVFEEVFAAFEILFVDFGFLGEGDVGGFEVGAFNPAEADIFGDKAFEVVGGAVEIALEDGSGEARVVGVDFFDEVDGALGVGRAFHVGADEDVVGFCGGQEGAVVGFGDFVALV